tara:strand:+ start:114538 stop:117762 length:3225 start_codon:yes stop_codon:yes gene_type:complete
MKNIIAYFIKHPIWANALIVVTFLFGMVSIALLDRSFFPVEEPNRINISVVYPGASPIEIEEGITVKIEQAIRGINGIDEISSTSSENISQVNVVLFKDADIDEALRDIENAVSTISSFPDGAEKPSVVKQRSFMNSRASFLSLSGNVSMEELKETADQIEEDLLNSEPISQVIVNGFPPQEISIEVKEEQLQRYNLTFDQVANAVRMNNRDVSAGTIETDEEVFQIRARGKHTTAEGIAKIPLKVSPDGTLLTIGDIADVKFQFADSPVKNYMDGKTSVILSVMKLENEDLGEIADYVANYVEEFNNTHDDMELRITFQFYDMLLQRIDMLVSNGLFGLILVLIVLGFFLNIRLAGWVAFGIPFSFLGMFMFGYLFGITINMVSLFGMILVVGILVDDGIVIAENIYTHYERGKSPFRATLDGTLEVMNSVFTSVLTTVVAFSVLFFIEGMERMKEMAFVVIASLLFSLLEAFLVLPSHLRNKKLAIEAQRKQNVKEKSLAARALLWVKRKVEWTIDYMRNAYAEMMKFVLLKKKVRRVMVLVPLLFMIIVGYLISSGIIKSTFFPSIPFDDFTVEIAYKPGETKEKTEEYLWYCYDKVCEVKDELIEEFNDTLITYVSLTLGSTEQLGESGSHAGMLRVSLDAEDADISSFEIANRVREKIKKDPSLEKFMVGGNNRWGKPVSISLEGDDYRMLKQAKNFLKKELEKMPELKDVTDNSGIGNRELNFTLKPKAKLLGLSHFDVAKQLRQGFYGEELQRLIVGTDEVKVWVRYPKSDRSSLGNIEEVRINTPTGKIPLKEIADYTIERGVVNIKHFNGKREINVSADQTDPFASTTEITAKIQKEIIPKLQQLYPDIKTEMRGQFRSAEKSGKSMGLMVVVLLILMILILALNFNSLLQALIFLPVLLIGPFCAILGHGIEDKPFSLLSVYGVIALLGILVNDSIVFLDMYNANLRQGMKVVDALFKAGKQRFRAIVLTSVTTVAGLYPLIGEKSFQAQFLIPMAISVAYGVLFGTFFILVFFPVLVAFVNDINRAVRWLWTGKKPTPEEVEPAIIDMREQEEIQKNLEHFEV